MEVKVLQICLLHLICINFLFAGLKISSAIELNLNIAVGSTSTTRASGTSATTSPSPTSLRWDRHTIQFSVNAWV